MDLKSVFSRFLSQVSYLHSQIAVDVQAIPLNERTLANVILMGPKLKLPENVNRYREDVYYAIEHGEDFPTVKPYGCFDHTDISALKAGFKFLSYIYKTPWYEVATERIMATPAELENISGLMATPSSLLALKYLWLAEYPEHPYQGILANTQPVRNALRYLYGTDFQTPIRSTMQQQRMATELAIDGLDAFNLNSVLWFMGQQ